MFDGRESKEVGHQNRYWCSSAVSAASAIAALLIGRRGAVTAHGSGVCHQDRVSLAESLWTGSICLLPAWCPRIANNTWCPQTSCAASRVGRSGASAVQGFLEDRLLGPLMGLGGCADALRG